jgi:hypothetical protein
MAIIFPSIDPVGISLRLGAYSASRATAPAGSMTIRQRSSHEYGLTAVVDFGTLDDDLLALIVITWYTAKGIYTPILLPSILLQGIATELKDTLPEHTSWYFADTISFASSKELPGYSNVSVSFEAEF